MFVATGSVALLADLIHNFGDAPPPSRSAIAFLLRSARAERYAGLFVVAAIFVSACVAGVRGGRPADRPAGPDHLVALAVAGASGSSATGSPPGSAPAPGARLDSAALVADGDHARADAYVSLGVVASAIVVALGCRSPTR